MILSLRKFGGKRDTGAIFRQERVAFTESDDEAGRLPCTPGLLLFRFRPAKPA